MKLTQNSAKLFCTILAFVVGFSSWVLFAENAWAQRISAPTSDTNSQIETIPVPPPNITSQIPFNPNRNSASWPYSPEIAFSEFAWQAFVALNWPAGCDGKPLEEKKIGEDPKAPRVWEFYNTPEQIFLPEGKNPSPVRHSVPPQCETKETLQNMQNYSANIRLGEAAGEIARFKQKVGLDLEKQEFSLEALNNFKQGQGEEIQEEIDRAISIRLPDRKVLVDQSKNYILSEIRMNPVEVGQIVNENWYSADNLQGFNNTVYRSGANPFALACSQKHPYGTYEREFPCLNNNDVGALELKAAWMVLPDLTPDEIESQYPTYYTTKRTFLFKEDTRADGQEKLVTVPVALIGFHVVQKTSRQAWSWATFEHLDNAPERGHNCEKTSYNLFNPNCDKNCEPNHPYAKTPYLWRDEYPHAVTRNKNNGEIKEQIPSQIIRMIPITKVAKSLNEEWQKKLKEIKSDFIWQNYELIGVQWLKSPSDPYPDGGFPNAEPLSSPGLANVALEPYTQTKPPVGSSCINCHLYAHLPGNKRKIHADFSFLLKYAQCPSDSGTSKTTCKDNYVMH